MKYATIIFCFIFFDCLEIWSQEKNPAAIINDYQVEFIIYSKAKAVKKVKKLITVYNHDGDSYAQPQVFYDKFIKIKNFDCTQTDILGKEIKKYKNSDILDQSITGGGTIFDDNRIKYVELLNNKYPYIVFFEYEQEYDGLFHYPSFSPQPGYDVAVEKSALYVEVPKDLDLRYKATFSDSLPVREEINEKLRYTWRLNQIEAVEKEALSPDIEEILPTLFLAANMFEYDGYSGSMDSWNSFGRWLYSLLPSKSDISEAERTEIKNISAAHENTLEKIQALYEYMQAKTRYVSIQLGIGGYQPMASEKVSELGYGDCKALSNYMRVILAEVSIPSFYTIIGAGRRNESFSYTDFPNGFQANHVILTVPLDKDTLFLECTNQKNPFGYLGSFTAGRNALLIYEEGGRMIKTTSYPFEDYLRQRQAKYTIDADGNIIGQYEKNYVGIAYEEVEGNHEKDRSELRNDFLSHIKQPGFNLKSIEYNFIKDRQPKMQEKVDFEIPQYAQVSGDRIFFKPNLFSKWTDQLPKDEDRSQPIVLWNPYYEVDSALFELPENFSLEASVNPLSLQTKFGQFKIETIVENNQLHYVRELKIYAQKYPKEDYQAFRTFLKEIIKADKAQVVLIERKT